MTKLTTHVLDTASGVPARNMTIRLFRREHDTRKLLLETSTNDDGRCDQPLLSGDTMLTGVYELEFEAGAYFGGADLESELRFLNCVILRFGISDPSSHYHVPLLVSPYSYSTYRGS